MPDAMLHYIRNTLERPSALVATSTGAAGTSVFSWLELLSRHDRAIMAICAVLGLLLTAALNWRRDQREQREHKKRMGGSK